MDLTNRFKTEVTNTPPIEVPPAPQPPAPPLPVHLRVDALLIDLKFLSSQPIHSMSMSELKSIPDTLNMLNNVIIDIRSEVNEAMNKYMDVLKTSVSKAQTALINLDAMLEGGDTEISTVMEEVEQAYESLAKITKLVATEPAESS